MSKITENTAVSVSVVVVILGGVFWLSVMYGKVDSSVSRLNVIEAKMSTTDMEIIDRLARIEEQLKYIGKQE